MSSYAVRFFAGPAGAAGGTELARVEGLACRYRYSTPSSRISLTGRRASSALAPAVLETEFARDQHGRIAGEVVVTGPDPACERD